MHAPALLITDFIKVCQRELLIDVRSPVEFKKGHIPGAINIPLFEDSERAEIGTLFKHLGKDSAVSRGMEIVSPKMEAFVNQVKKLSSNNKAYIYCYRGGMRSNSFAWLMNNSGLEARILEGGYKVYRNYILNFFNETKKIILIGGKTGSGKTEILKELIVAGYQVIDLEHLANHKGSAFGAINEKTQEPQQLFENNLFNALSTLDAKRSIILEDESKNIGFNKIPHALWLQMKTATIIKIEIPLEMRVTKLVVDYSTQNIDALKECVKKISQQLGTANTKLCMQLLDENNLAEVARIALQYYDKAYNFIYENKTQSVYDLSFKSTEASFNVKEIINLLDSLN